MRLGATEAALFSPSGDMSVAEKIALLSPEQRLDLIHRIGEDEFFALMATWEFWARPEQMPPKSWFRWWLLITGRGFGKNRTAGEWVIDRAERFDNNPLVSVHRVALVSRSYADVRDVMIEGESGLVAICERRGIRSDVNRTLPARLELPDLRTVMLSYSAEEPSKMRGPNFHTAWMDEPSTWSGRVDAMGESAWSILDMALRLPPDPRGIGTMTPKPVPLVTQWVSDAKNPDRGITITTGSTLRNAANLDRTFMASIMARYENTRLGAQEIEGMLLEEAEGAYWTSAILNETRVGEVPVVDLPLDVWVGVDPPAEAVAECGIIVAGSPKRQRKATRHAYVLDDFSLHGPPEVWARRVVDAVRYHQATGVVAEVNNGGDMVRAVIHAIDPTIKVEKVRASQNKQTRAEPVAIMYDRHRAHHVNFLGFLEAQQMTWVPGEGPSPDRVDACVWVLTHLLPIKGANSGSRAVVAA